MKIKKTNWKQWRIQDELHHKNINCTSTQMIKWCKNYLNRSNRRIDKQNLKQEGVIHNDRT